MKFMLMMHTPPGPHQVTQWSPDDVKAMVGFMKKLESDLKASGQLVLAEGLTGPDQARIVRADDQGRPTVTDGPFTETKEFIAGFWIVNVQTADEAYGIAARASSAPGPGGKSLKIPIEVREVGAPPPTD